ncbi:MAG: hypothetical protein A3J83_00270 [Elusimicrobia bacterium RIFOXYA2_FULL_40_6]|nr:MAG: hypothetical protein A3J83_00270 [Elusimicrobia bacterium RIFOXYA2_FULL_40_6]
MKKKSLFVIGDSISMHYGPYLKKMIKDKFVYSRVRGNGEDSRNVLKIVARDRNRLSKLDVLLLNCGLHDIKINHGKTGNQVPVVTYAENLKKIISLLKKMKLATIWLRITHIDDKQHKKFSKYFDRCHKDVVKYNLVADKIMKQNKIQSIDLYSFTKKLGNDLFCDHVHFKDQIRKLQAAYIAGRIKNVISTGK